MKRKGRKSTSNDRKGKEDAAFLVDPPDPDSR